MTIAVDNKTNKTNKQQLLSAFLLAYVLLLIYIINNMNQDQTAPEGAV